MNKQIYHFLRPNAAKHPARPGRPTVFKRMAAAAAAITLLGLILTSHTTQADSYTAKVYTTSLNVRSEPAGGAAVTGSVKGGSLVTVSEEQHGWLKIRSGSMTGWVAGYYLKKAGGSAASSQATVTAAKKSTSSRPSTATVTADSLRIRSGPGTGYDVVGSLQARDAVAILSRQSGWLNIRAEGGVTGWVAEPYVTAGTSAASAVGIRRTSSSADVSRPASAGLRGKRIVVDPGHGGDDPGMIGTTYGTMEKDLNLQTALYLRDYLKAAGARVTMTRTQDDERPSLSTRAELAQSVSADAFISVHFNSSPKKVSGTLTFFYSESDDLKLARAIENRLSEGIGLKSNGLSFGDYHILRTNETPAALVELGFLTSPTDESIVRRASYQRKAAQAIADGIADYLTQ
ncbi:N-acetylmuramoyl-L-alanine amidase [Paenibacillus sophorae]|uniref:N-acetylmuramoyl-L-alanine amidase n=1 Tax=Paenibacillus sophorae TaxID=1333845 RepID=A0A1H8SSK1_9BACL|nr:N-acetylmuramoyl-L-alanine amidase [Paenibacillus sophorae]QWU15547.1 N-acetylmuramoyl-L-alanine amidase [Paenibacillus sophorae]SEO81672.1 N-acetylmuramoyl-L-alanine amidase [Paenibacillus sophorae]